MIFLTSSCQSFDWEARPWIPDTKTQKFYNANGETIDFDQPQADELTCFDAENIAELKTEIDRVNGKSKAVEEVEREIKNIRQIIR